MLKIKRHGSNRQYIQFIWDGRVLGQAKKCDRKWYLQGSAISLPHSYGSKKELVNLVRETLAHA